MNNRRRGDYHERRIREQLWEAGWVVVRAGGSLGAVDLLAVKYGRTPVIIQAKLDGRLDPEPWNALIEIARTAGAVPVMAWRPRPGVIAYGILTKSRKAWERIDPLLQDWRP